MKSIIYNQETKKFSTEKSKEFDSSWYEKNGFILDPRISREHDYLTLVGQTKIEKAWNIFAKTHGLLPMEFYMNKSRGGSKWNITCESKPFTPTDQILKKAFRKFTQDSFGGGDIDYYEKPEGFYFKPYIWFNIHLDWESTSGGSNGTELMIDESNRVGGSVWYLIFENKFVTLSEYNKLTRK